MDWTTEHHGDSRTVSLTADGYVMSTPGNTPGSCRLYEFVPDATRGIVLPACGYSRPGEHITVWNNNATHSILVVDRGLGTLVTTIAPQNVVTFYLKEATSVGVWALRTYGASAASASLSMDRVPLDHHITTDVVDFDLREYWDAHGYDGVTPAALRVWMATESYNYIAGASTTSEVAFDSGEWPTGTTLLLFNHGVISGKGGAGGRGGDVPPGLLAGVGQPAGDAMKLRVDTALVNYGTIQGGGGGGGGGIEVNGAAGGGGGGGAGHTHSAGGLAGLGGGGLPGASGSLYGFGSPGGGGMSGGFGGPPGLGGNQASGGTSLGAAGGAAGRSILSLTGITLTKLRTGTITGAEATF